MSHDMFTPILYTSQVFMYYVYADTHGKDYTARVTQQADVYIHS